MGLGFPWAVTPRVSPSAGTTERSERRMLSKVGPNSRSAGYPAPQAGLILPARSLHYPHPRCPAGQTAWEGR